MSRELDAEVAEKVFGWTIERGTMEYDGSVSEWMTFHTPEGIKNPIPFSTDIAAAWLVVDYLRTRDIWLERLEQKWETQTTRVIFEWRDPERGLRYAQEMGDTPPHAICLAALKVAEDTR